MDRPTMAQMLMSEPLEDGEGPGGIGEYLMRRGARKLRNAGMDALYGIGSAAAGSILAPATGGLSYIPGYGIAGMNLGRAASGLGDALLHGIAAQRFSRMPQSPPEGN
jgi:hypothetical protein